MKKLFILLAIFTTFATTAQSVGINADGSAANASAILDLKTTTQGFLPPRMTTVQRNAISNPASGLVIFNTTSNALNIYFSGAWYQLSTSLVPGSITTLNTASPTTYGTLSSGIAASGVSSVVPYTGGNGETHSGQTVFSTGATGLTATLSPGTFAVGNGTLTYNITGTASKGEASFALNIGGQTSTLTRSVSLGIGDEFQGGIIAYILQSGDPGYDANVQHGLIAAPSDQGTEVPWGCQGTEISGATGTAIETGNQNTIAIMAGCSTAGIAARLCGDLVLGGYSDWYLPSKDELNKLYTNRVAIGLSLNPFDSYWSSSEYNSDRAWVLGMESGAQGLPEKGFVYRVRAIRAF